MSCGAPGGAFQHHGAFSVVAGQRRGAKELVAGVVVLAAAAVEVADHRGEQKVVFPASPDQLKSTRLMFEVGENGVPQSYETLNL
jgi:hypothetical protein